MTAAERILARLAEHADEAFTHSQELLHRGEPPEVLAHAEGWRFGTATAYAIALEASREEESAVFAGPSSAPLSLGAQLDADHARHAYKEAAERDRKALEFDRNVLDAYHGRTPESDREEDR